MWTTADIPTGVTRAAIYASVAGSLGSLYVYKGRADYELTAAALCDLRGSAKGAGRLLVTLKSRRVDPTTPSDLVDIRPIPYSHTVHLCHRFQSSRLEQKPTCFFRSAKSFA